MLIRNGISTGPTQTDRKIQLALKRAADLELETGELVVCDPHGSEETKLHRYLARIEPQIMEVSAAKAGVGGFQMVLGMIDKARQSPINMLGGMEFAGQMAMDAYWNVADHATTLMCNMEGFDMVKVDLIRVSPKSDEGIFIMGGPGVTASLASRFGPDATLRGIFKTAWKMAREQLDLRRFTYTLEVPKTSGGAEAYELDLEAFSRVLRHPEMVVACHTSISEPRAIGPDDKPGFIQDEIRRLENTEIGFFDRLPACFRGNNGGKSEVESPFFTNMAMLGERTRKEGAFVEIKLHASDEDARALLAFTKDTPQYTGTCKGYAAIFSGNFGMSAFNTFIGKARANKVLTSVAQAMGDFSRDYSTVLPINGGHLAYWVDMDPNELTAELIRRAVMNRLSGGSRDPDIGLEPNVIIVDAKGLDIADTRARFILDSMGKETYPPAFLCRTDFVLNFLENVHPQFQQQIFDELALPVNGGRRITAEDLDHMRDLRRICSMHRTIRDTEDMVWTIRNDTGIPAEISAKRDALETWLFDFAAERYEHMYRLLADKIMAQVRNR
jgi:hypothetical protein